MKHLKLIALAVTLIFATACKKDKKEAPTSADSSEDRPDIVNKEAIA